MAEERDYSCTDVNHHYLAMIHVFREGSLEFSRPVPKFLSESMSGSGLGDALAPMPGVIEKVNCSFTSALFLDFNMR